MVNNKEIYDAYCVYVVFYDIKIELSSFFLAQKNFFVNFFRHIFDKILHFLFAVISFSFLIK